MATMAAVDAALDKRVDLGIKNARYGTQPCPAFLDRTSYCMHGCAGAALAAVQWRWLTKYAAARLQVPGQAVHLWPGQRRQGPAMLGSAMAQLMCAPPPPYLA